MRIVSWVGPLGNKFGGFERYNITLAEKCKRKGHQLIVLHDIENTVPEYNRRLKAVGSKQIVIGHSYERASLALINLIRLIWAWKPDVVHLHFGNPVGLPLLKLFRVPLVYQTWHNSITHRIRLRTRLIRKIATYCTTRTFAVSKQVCRDEIRAGVPAGHIQTLYLGLPVYDFVASAEIANDPIVAGFNCSAKKIITVSRFYPQKGMTFIVEAAIRVLKRDRDVLWWLVGDGPEKERLQALAQKADVSDRLLFLGTRSDVAVLMRRAYVHVLGSVFEGLPLVALEAAAFGVPTVGPNIGGLDEAVIDGVTGLLVEPESSDALTAGTLRILADSQLRDCLGKAAERFVFEHFDSTRLVDDLIQIYEIDERKKYDT